MRNVLLLFAFLFLLSSCTKEVPESEKKTTKYIVDFEVRKVIDNISTHFNSREIDSALTSFSKDYSEFVPDADSARSLNVLKNDWQNFISQNPKGEMQTIIEDVFVSEGLAAVQTFTSYMVINPLDGKLIPAYSERSIKLLRNSKDENWKIFRSLSSTAFSYD